MRKAYRTEEQIRASRANGARSRGPVTEAGKRRPSANALRHGIYSNQVVIKDESPKEFEAVHRQYHATLSPTSAIELEAVRELAENHWRMRRLWALETQTLNQAMADAPDTLSGDDRTLAAYQSTFAKIALLSRYTTHYHMRLSRALRSFSPKVRERTQY